MNHWARVKHRPFSVPTQVLYALADQPSDTTLIDYDVSTRKTVYRKLYGSSKLTRFFGPG